MASLAAAAAGALVPMLLKSFGLGKGRGRSIGYGGVKGMRWGHRRCRRCHSMPLTIITFPEVTLGGKVYI